MLSLLLAFSLPISLQSCSNVLLPSSPHSSAIHARTMDLGSWVDFTFVAEPPATSDTLGYIGVVPSARHLPVAIKKAVTAGINTNGLSCDMQTLINTQYPEKPTDKIGVLNGFFCEWVLRSYSNVNEVLEALALSHQVSKSHEEPERPAQNDRLNSTGSERPAQNDRLKHAAERPMNETPRSS